MSHTYIVDNLDTPNFGIHPMRKKMRLKLLSAAICLVSTSAMANPMALYVDQARPINLKQSATGVVVGNAGIADVIVHDAHTIIVMGKSVGITNILVLGEKGRTLYSANVSVSMGDASNTLTVQKGSEIETKLCADRCIDIVHPEETSSKLTDAATRIRTRAMQAKGN
jgi:Flp pilus assembly secretin CpaC